MTSYPTVLGAGGHAATTSQPYQGHVYANVGLGRSPMISDGFRTEAYVSQIVRTTGAISYLSWGLDTALGAPLTLYLNRNSSATALAVFFSATTTGWMTDSADSASVSSGQSLDFDAYVDAMSPVCYIGSFYCVSARFDAASDSAQMLVTVGTGETALNLSTTQKYLNFLGILGAGDLTESNQQSYCLAAGVWRNMACYTHTNTFNRTVTFNNRKNGNNGSMVISVPAGTSGEFEDVSTTNHDSISVSDLLDYGVMAAAAGSGDFIMDWIGAHFFASDPAACMIGGTPLFFIGGAIVSGVTAYTSLFGGSNVETSVARATGTIPYASDASSYVNHLTQAGFNAAAAFTVLINNAASMLSVSSISGTTGYFIDNSHSVTVSAGDICSNRVVGSGQMNTSVVWDGAGLLLTASS